MALQSLTIFGFTLMEDGPPILNITAGLTTLKRCDTVLAKGSDFNQKWVADIGRRRLVHVEQNSFRSSSPVALVAIQTQGKFGNLFFVVGFEPNPWSRFHVLSHPHSRNLSVAVTVSYLKLLPVALWKSSV